MTLETSIAAGLAFLERHEIEGGGWWVEVAPTPDLREAEQRHNVFTAAFILREIAPVVPEAALVRRTVDFLLAQRRGHGLWNFYRRGDRRIFPADLDTNACVGSALLLAGAAFDHGHVISEMECYHHPAGGYWVFMIPPEGSPLFPLPHNVRDHVVNGHVLLFLALAGVDCAPFTEWMVWVLRSREYLTWQPFYDAPLLFLNMMARSLAVLPDVSPQLRAEVARHLLAQGQTQTLNSLELAYVISGLAACGYHELAPFVERVLAGQRADGGWDCHVFHGAFALFYGAREVVTAAAVHALHQAKAI